MRFISTEGFEEPKKVCSGPAPILRWLKIADLVVDETYQRPILGKGRKNISRIARNFAWSHFAPVVVAPIEGGKFCIIDGQHRTTAAALAGFNSVPCQIVIAAQKEQAAAFKAISGVTTPVTPLALYAAATIAEESWAVELARVCAAADVELLRYPVSSANQSPGQTMAIGAISKCLERYGRETLITALQCITQTANNQTGMLTARLIKGLCEVLDSNKRWRDSGLALLLAFDQIDLNSIQDNAAVRAAREGVSLTVAIASTVREELERALPDETGSVVNFDKRSSQAKRSRAHARDCI